MEAAGIEPASRGHNSLINKEQKMSAKQMQSRGMSRTCVFAKAYKDCKACDFYQIVKAEEGDKM